MASVSLLGALRDGATTDLQFGARVEVPWSRTAGAWIQFGGYRWADGHVDALDGLLSVRYRLVQRPDLMVSISPGVSLPFGSLADGLGFSPLSTASFDPCLGVDVVGGAAWLGVASGMIRVPVYPGWDGLRQGPFMRLDARLARRAGDWIPWLGLGTTGRFASSPSATDKYFELAAIGGVAWQAHERWSLTLQTRVPVWSAAVGGTYNAALSMGVTGVFGKRDTHDSSEH